MTLVTTLPIGERLNFNLADFFKKSNSETPAPDSLSEKRIENELTVRINSAGIVKIDALNKIPADRIFLAGRYIITLRLTDQYAKYFVLLRGLLEFSRPKSIKVSSDMTQKTFNVEISEAQFAHFVSYIETIQGWLIKEIKFKEALKALITFEKKVKQEQAILYSNVQASLA